MHNKDRVWNHLTIPKNFTVYTIDVWEWIRNFISHFIIDVIYLSMLRLKLIHVSNRSSMSQLSWRLCHENPLCHLENTPIIIWRTCPHCPLREGILICPVKLKQHYWNTVFLIIRIWGNNMRVKTKEICEHFHISGRGCWKIIIRKSYFVVFTSICQYHILFTTLKHDPWLITFNTKSATQSVYINSRVYPRHFRSPNY